MYGVIRVMAVSKQVFRITILLTLICILLFWVDFWIALGLWVIADIMQLYILEKGDKSQKLILLFLDAIFVLIGAMGVYVIRCYWI